jgi:hypothetical protein
MFLGLLSITKSKELSGLRAARLRAKVKHR